MEAQNFEREALEQQSDDGQQIGFANLLYRGHQFPLGDDVDGVDMVDTLHPILIALMHGIDADIAGYSLRGWRFANANGERRCSRAFADQALLAIQIAGAQVVPMRDRDLRQTNKAQITERRKGTDQQHLRCRAGECIVQAVGLGE